MSDCETVMRYVLLAHEKVRIDIAVLVALEEGSVKKCGMTEAIVFFEVLY